MYYTFQQQIAAGTAGSTGKEYKMSGFGELDAVVTLADQMRSEVGPVVLVNLFTVDAGEEDALLSSWAHDADFMKQQPGYISTQMHKGIAGSSTYMNYAVWQSVPQVSARRSPTRSFSAASQTIRPAHCRGRICSES